jgi:hypothetical protein
MNDMKDIDGTVIKPGDKVSTIYGECIIQEPLQSRNPMATAVRSTLGDALRVKDAKGTIWDILVQPAKVRLVVHIDPSARTTTQKYGV